MDISQLLYSLVVLHAGYLASLSFRQPSTKIATTSLESRFMWFFASPQLTTFARLTVVLVAGLHALVSRPALSIGTLPRSVCPTPEHLDPRLFTWSIHTVLSLLLLYAGSCIRLQAYAQLGANFTYRLTKPDQLVTSGLYAWVRHPSYTGLFIGVFGMWALFGQQRGLLSCWVPLVDERLVTDGRFALVPLVAFAGVLWLFVETRVKEEEKLLEGEFGESWREQCRRTARLVPFVY